MFLAMAWHAHRKLAAERSHHLISEHNARLLADQRRFLQDAAHQLRTPITIALGHAELLAARSPSRRQQEGEDIEVVIGELNRLRRISERLLHHRRRRRPGVPAPGAGRARPADHRADPPLAAHRRPVLADRAARPR